MNIKSIIGKTIKDVEFIQCMEARADGDEVVIRFTDDTSVTFVSSSIQSTGVIDIETN